MSDVLLDNGHLRLCFSPQGCLTSIVPSSTRDELLKGLRTPVPVFTLLVDLASSERAEETDSEPIGDIVELVTRYVRPSDQVEAVPIAATVMLEDDVVVIRSEAVRTPTAALPIRAEVRVRLAADAAESYWTVTLHNHDSTRTVCAVTLPRIHGLQLGESVADDALYSPFRGGERFPSAVQDFADIAEGRLTPLEMGQPRIVKRDGRYTYELPYAGRASMMWMTYTDPTGGLYLGSHDPEFLVTVLHADTEGPDSGAMNLELRKWVTVKPGQTWASAPFVVASYDGDWHWAAQRYRRWFDTEVPLSHHGGPLRESVGAYLPFLKAADGRVQYTFRDLPGLYDKAAAAGLDQLMPYGWMSGGFDTSYPEFYPDLELGGPMEMAKAHNQVRRRGGRVVSYLNSRIFNRRSIHFDKLGREWAAKDLDGNAWTERYGQESFAVMCPGAPGWTALLTDFAESLVRMYGTRVVYFDQLSAMAVPCHDDSHGHQETGLRNQQYARLLETASAACRQVDPEVAFSIEQASDIYAPYALFQGTIGLWLAGSRFNFPEMFKYTFPEVIGISFVFYTRQLPGALFAPLPELPRDEAAYWLCREILTGAIFGVLDQNFADQPWWDEAQGLLGLRRVAAPWMGHGVFRDDVDVVTASAGLDAKTFALDGETTKSVLIGVHNPELADGRHVEIRWKAATDPIAFRLAADGSKTPLELAVGATSVTFEASPELLSMTVIEA